MDLSFQPFIDVRGVILPFLIAAHRRCFGFHPQSAGTPVKLALLRIPARGLIPAPGGSTRDKCQYNRFNYLQNLMDTRRLRASMPPPLIQLLGDLNVHSSGFRHTFLRAAVLYTVVYPPATAPTTSNGSFPFATASGINASGDSCD